MDLVQLHPIETDRGQLGLTSNHLVMKLEERGLGTIMVGTNHSLFFSYLCLGAWIGEMEIDITRAPMSDRMNRLPLSIPVSMGRGIGKRLSLASSIVQRGTTGMTTFNWIGSMTV